METYKDRLRAKFIRLGQMAEAELDRGNLRHAERLFAAAYVAEVRADDVEDGVVRPKASYGRLL